MKILGDLGMLYINCNLKFEKFHYSNFFGKGRMKTFKGYLTKKKNFQRLRLADPKKIRPTLRVNWNQ